jgi:N-acetylglucosamine kinase-like BadF-type ATPase
MVTGLVLGLDGGGTQMRAQVATQDGVVRGVGLSGPCNIAAMTATEALQSAQAAADAALLSAHASSEVVCAVCAGVAGTSYTARRAEFRQGLQEIFPNAQVSVVPDYAIALTGGTDGAAGIIVIAGTGSVAYGEDGNGTSHKSGGYGFLIDDAGSGYGVGRSALAAVLRADDGTGAATSLTECVPGALGLASVHDIVSSVYSGDITRVQIAGLARAVAETANGEDSVACAILMRAGGALALLAHGVVEQVFSHAETSFPVILVGGLWSAGPILTDVFERSLKRFAPLAVVTTPRQSPVTGAVRRARRLTRPSPT